MRKGEEKKNHVWETIKILFFVLIIRMYFKPMFRCVSLYFKPSKIHVLGWEVFIILVSVFKSPADHWHQTGFSLKHKAWVLSKWGMRRCRHPEPTDTSKTVFVPGGKAEEKEMSLIYHITFQSTTQTTPVLAKWRHQPGFAFGLQAQSTIVRLCGLFLKNPTKYVSWNKDPEVLAQLPSPGMERSRRATSASLQLCSCQG